jgi:hypothetical protein
VPKWLKDIERGMERGGVDEPFALMNSMGIKRGSKTVVNEKGARKKMRAYGRRVGRRRRDVSASEAGDAMARSKRG